MNDDWERLAAHEAWLETVIRESVAAALDAAIERFDDHSDYALQYVQTEAEKLFAELVPSSSTAERLANPRPRVTQEVRWTVFQRDGYRCRSCGATSDLTLDHVTPVSRGGTDALENLQTLCRACNSRKGAS